MLAKCESLRDDFQVRMLNNHKEFVTAAWEMAVQMLAASVPAPATQEQDDHVDALGDKLPTLYHDVQAALNVRQQHRHVYRDDAVHYQAVGAAAATAARHFLPQRPPASDNIDAMQHSLVVSNFRAVYRQWMDDPAVLHARRAAEEAEQAQNAASAAVARAFSAPLTDKQSRSERDRVLEEERAATLAAEAARRILSGVEAAVNERLGVSLWMVASKFST